MSTTPTSTTPSKRPAVMCPYCVSERRAREKRLRKSSAGCSPAAAAAPPPPPVGCPIVIIDDDDDEDEDEVDKEEEEVGGAVHDGHEKRRAAQGTRSKKGGQGEAPVIVISSSSEGEEESEAADIGKSGARGGAAMGTDKVQASAAAVMGAKEPQPAVVAEVAVVRADDSTKLVGEVVDNPQECERERSNAATNVPGEENANSKPNLSEIDTHEKSEQDTITTPSPFLPVPQAYDSFNDTDFIFDESILDDTFAAMSKQSNHTTETTSTSTSIENTKIDALNAMAEELACMPSENLFTTGSLQQTKFLQIRVNEITREGGASVTAFTGTCCNVDGRVDLQLPVTIQLEGIWRLSPIENGSVVHVIGGHHSAYSVITLQDSEGIIIVHPEILISASLLGATSPCLRQSVLRNTVKNVGTTKASLIGQISHSIFEEALSSSSFTESTVAKAMDDIIQDNIPSLFAVGLTDQATRSSLLPTIATISKWASTFLPTITHLTKSLGSCPPEVYFGHERKTVKITSVLGIEEGIWSLMYGVKGILDAHIRAEVDGVSSEIPLELKTGKPHTDHKAQVLLYMLLMSEHFKTETSKGLLYYMNGHNRFGIGNMMGISSSCTELAAILHQRNMLATALSTHILPPTCLSSECSSCSNSFTCALFNKAFEQGDLVKVNPLVSHLLPAHFLFFRKWSRLISLEAQSGHQVFLDLISKTPSKRELSGSCLCNLTLHTSLRQGFHYFHTFFTQNSTVVPLSFNDFYFKLL
ncbi:DNA replication factor Dna2 [Pelomyxa schiedti]|nr:DNA replication factor Dna2 [Pelomyxa schiedti]